MTTLIEETYSQFLGKALEGRKAAGKKEFTLEQLKGLAGGRVWTGRQALANGLVDELGTVEKAIAYARDQTDLPKDKQPEILRLPKPRNMLEELLDFDLGVHAKTGNFGSLDALVRELPAEFRDMAMQTLRLARMRGGPVYFLPLEPFHIR